jgi:hypothetical protein
MADLNPNDELAALMTELSENPATRKQTLRDIKKIRPNLAIPEIDNEDAINTVAEELRADNQALREELRNRDLQGALKERRQRIKTQHQLTDDDVSAIEETLIKPGKIADHDTAAAYFAMERRMSTPTPHKHHRAKPFEGIDLAKYQADPEGAMLDDMTEAWDELQSGSVRLQ